MNSKSMTRTFAFAGVAILSTLLAIAANQLTKPAKFEGEGDFDKPFNPDFTDAGRATAIQVVSWDEATASAKPFSVEYKDGWKIPSYHNYPADGKDQLAKAAASVIGLKRGSLATRYKTDHERYGVIDPLDESNPATKGRGTRITLLEKDVTLADFIVGNKSETNEEKRYVRKYGEDKVYVVRAKFDVSTKFADWAETDLLKVTGFDITRLRGSRPKINADDEYEGDESVELTRDKSGDPWKLAGLDEATEELKTDDINTMVTTLDDLRLVGVRPRPAPFGKPLLNADLKVELPPELMADQRIRSEIIKSLRADLGEKGFKVGQDQEGRTQLVSREGELITGTKDGVVYRLTFGSVFSGTEQEIEVGTKDESKADDKEKKETDKKGELKKSRYLLVRADFDQKLLGDPPTEPTKPTPPPGVEPPADAKSDDDKKDNADKKDDAPKTEKKDADSDKPKEKDADKADDAKCDDADKDKEEKAEKKADAPKADDKKSAEEKTDEKKKPADDPADKPKDDKPDTKKDDAKPDESKKDEAKKDDAKPDEPKKDLKAEYLEALKRYDGEKGRFVAETRAFEAKIESGKQKVKELNDRFADWYYVISNDSFDKLRLSRADLIKKKETPAEKTDAEKKEGDQPAEKPEAEKKDGDKKDADKPAEKEKTDAEKKTDTEKSEADKTEKKDADKSQDDK